MRNFNKDILYSIFLFLQNSDVFRLPQICKFYRNITLDPFFFNKIKYRPHPLVFNYYDNMCNVCNLRIYFITNNNNFVISRCNHY